MFDYKLPNGVPVKNVLKAIVGRPPPQSNPYTSQTSDEGTPAGIYQEDGRIDPYDDHKVYQMGSNGNSKPGNGGGGRWDSGDDSGGDWRGALGAADGCFGKSTKSIPLSGASN